MCFALKELRQDLQNDIYCQEFYNSLAPGVSCVVFPEAKLAKRERIPIQNDNLVIIDK
jgi:hypothetical protein